MSRPLRLRFPGRVYHVTYGRLHRVGYYNHYNLSIPSCLLDIGISIRHVTSGANGKTIYVPRRVLPLDTVSTHTIKKEREAIDPSAFWRVTTGITERAIPAWSTQLSRAAKPKQTCDLRLPVWFSKKSLAIH